MIAKPRKGENAKMRLKEKLVGLVLLALPVCIAGLMQFSWRWTAMLVGFSLVTVVWGSGAFYLAKRHVRPKLQDTFLWSAAIGLLSALMACCSVYLIGVGFGSILASHDQEGYLWGVAILAVIFGLLAIPFGWGLGQSKWRNR